MFLGCPPVSRLELFLRGMLGDAEERVERLVLLWRVGRRKLGSRIVGVGGRESGGVRLGRDGERGGEGKQKESELGF